MGGITKKLISSQYKYFSHKRHLNQGLNLKDEVAETSTLDIVTIVTVRSHTPDQYNKLWTKSGTWQAAVSVQQH